MEITLSRVVEAARQRRAAVTAEGGGYIVLLATTRLAAHPCQVTPDLIGLTATGEVLLAAGTPADPLETERGLRQLLRLLMGLAHTSPPALVAAGERVATGNLAAFEAELLAALIPLNHGAAGRALARLFRETQRATRGPVSAEPGAPEHGSPPPASVSSGVATPVAAAAAPVSRARTETPVATPLSVAPLTPASAVRPLPASETPLPPLVTPLPLALTPVPTPTLASFAQAAPCAELDIDVEIVLGDAGESDDVDVSVEELDPSSAELDVLLAADVAETTPAPFALGDTPSLPGGGLGDAELAESPLPDSSALIAAHADLELPPQRSDLRELLNCYLAHTRSAANMTADLRRRVGL